VVDYAEKAEVNDIVIDIKQQLKIFIAKQHLPLVNGSELDYVKQGLNEHFVFNNPNEIGSCGCGESFTVKE